MGNFRELRVWEDGFARTLVCAIKFNVLLFLSHLILQKVMNEVQTENLYIFSISQRVHVQKLSPNFILPIKLDILMTALWKNLKIKARKSERP